MINNINFQNIHSFENPFEDFNANLILPERILSLWCTPFDNGLIKGISEEGFATQAIPIFLQGVRGSGKTTILKYFSYALQIERSKANGITLLQQIFKDKCIGFYYRCDDAFINNFKSTFESQSLENWLPFFEHYFELVFLKQLIALYENIISENKNNFNAECEKMFCKETFLDGGVSSIKELKCILEKEIHYIDDYRNNIIFDKNIKFTPSISLSLYKLSKPFIDIILRSFSEIKNVVFLLLIDEFENLPYNIQKFFNTKVKLVENGISIRIGRRSEGNITFETINSDEYLRVNNDFSLVEINKDLDQETQKKYFFELAQKRFNYSAISFKGKSILDILTDKEDLVEESKKICKNRTNHLKYILSEKSTIKDNESLLNEIIEIIKYPDNPIAETICAFWVIRGKGDHIENAKCANKAMRAFFSKDSSDSEYKKFKNDYSNKYKYTIAVLLASLYKKKKMYYGFNTLVHLSDGNPRTFINFCKSIISDAYFYERERLMESQTISFESQDRAIREFSNAEFDGICSIINYGNQIRNLVLNVGNTFAEYHKDKRARYPETNQFVFNKLELTEEIRKAIDTAESWAIIRKKEKMQRVSTGIDKKGDIYFINRAFCPIFGISYRIRGGFNVEFSSDQISQMMVALITVPKIGKIDNVRNKTNNTDDQLTLFDKEGNDND